MVIKTTKKKCDDNGFRRAEDIERITKLEYVVYDNHHTRLEGHGEELKLLIKNQTHINNHLKAIKYVCFGLFLGAIGSAIGWTNVGKLIIPLIGI